ncbi:nucleobase:cation symporter-2 family protein [Methylorubrum rhodesianum]|jgi:uric acid transporter|uniref:Nucleobase:cation symporter-2 family protein n=1 Tax=Methylorubrum rhodesianum TaxID=29427 RepID=A0ABU9Z9K9_9HYPH|nr:MULTISPECIES: nucleobase:cation symporter-2 family protein [Methylorubrum]MBB5763262.1 NCS2 family nucleobase:cation symporter-2 [Methylorubrum rhodesianum]MBI1689012.1 purine permease [Methylorubrum sp. DB1722]MBK3401404.1 purine permease [Methylorubrum rhodesianum]MBY0143545.1 purine permease [Methylorubrum populi]
MVSMASSPPASAAEIERRNPRKPDERVPRAALGLLGLQHVLVMYAGAVAIPLIIGRALKLPPEQVAMLVSADLFACGIVTLIQSWGLPGIGIRMPVMMGVTFAAVGPMLSMGTNPAIGLTGIYGAVIASGLFGLVAAPLVGRLLPLFPPVVTGTIILVIGISLMRVGVNWAAGGVGNPNYGAPLYLGIAAFVLCAILAITRYATGFVASASVLIGIALGMILAGFAGLVELDRVAAAPWFDVVRPFAFGWPSFDPVSIVTLCLVMIVVMIESTGMFLALSQITADPVDGRRLTRGLRADGLGTVIGGIFNTFPYTSFSQNIGLVGVTGIRSRWVTVVAGFIMLGLGLVPKLAALVEAVPQCVLGGAGLVMFGMVGATGTRILGGVDFARNRNNLFVVAVSVGFGMIPLVAPNFFKQMPHALHPLLESGILLAAISAVGLNLFFNGFGDRAESREAAIRQAEVAQAH